MGTACQECWVPEMADLLVREVVEQMSGIQLGSCPPGSAQPMDMDVVYGLVDGEYQMNLHFKAERRLFNRFARNMIGGEPQSEDEVREYATEFFNILCGRFVSEIYHSTRMAARFLPTQYGKSFDKGTPEPEKVFCTRCFLSDEQEFAEFSWTKYRNGNACWKVRGQ